ncbi:AfsR/SARP family transcriptional regulator [Actinocrispum wychmicini]|uniref:DNA-binding SARP family transcriptional activator n=1 Tax=Actinocrispum wychmicini TaxID=1213861 RepID=A0A4R2JP03_9PSEU|nr:AfsR/SARP family transcriptional regulator [Actinocrispum wychmicini]TCO60717.1 DNA-binding SARP family transcriptional activator [Actinocrispum wychmicini]
MRGLAKGATHGRFTLLGPLSVRNDAGTVALGGVRAQCVLAALMLNAGKVTSVDQLVGAAWATAPPAGARVLVQNRISVVRRVFRVAGLSPELITTVGSGYVFQVGDGVLDLDLFDRRVARAEELSAAGDITDAVGELTAALALWNGPALAGLTTPPIVAAAHQLEERRIRALKQRITLELALDRHAELLGELTGLVGDHPYQEDLRGLLMVALARSGRQAEALAVYRDTRTVFTEQLGIEPSPSLARLHEAVLRDERAEPLSPFGPDDWVRPDPPVPHELPAAPVPFTGRDKELRLLDSALGDRTGSITAIDGMAGVGKSTLALHWAHQVARWFPDGQLHVDLRGDDHTPLPPIEALGLLLGALGHPAEQVPADLGQAAALYRSALAGRRVLVVVDNARSIGQVRPLLPGSPGTVVLVTSRQRLSGLSAREGARRMTVDVLEPVDAHTCLELLLGEDRVRAEPRATTRLATMCGHLPLALHAAASRLTDGRRVADLVTEMRSGVPDLVLAALEPSYRGLPARARRLFRLLGLVPGADITSVAAAALAGMDPTAAELSLDQLVGAHLIEEYAPNRFRLHRLVRHYATERAVRSDDAIERASAVLRLVQWYLRHARAAIAWLNGARFGALFDGPAQAARWLDAEWGNLAAVVRHGSFWLAWLLGEADSSADRAADWWGGLPPSPRQPSRDEQGTRVRVAQR